VDSILPALLAVTVLVLASLTLGRSSFTSFEVLGQSFKDAEERALERTRSDIQIASITVTGNDVTVSVTNEGATEVVDFSRMDVVVQYQSGDAINGYEAHTVWLPYTTEPAQPDNTWTVTSITNDVIDPGVLNTGETLNLRLRLNPAVGTGTSNWLQVTTELGISASLFFTN
jgi:hypothetical protein